MAKGSYFAKHMQTTSDGIKCIPKTYILNNDNSSLSLPEDIYILKANRQRQEGIMITKDIKYKDLSFQQVDKSIKLKSNFKDAYTLKKQLVDKYANF